MYTVGVTVWNVLHVPWIKYIQ